jgi:superfamily II DNA/RNA helicase
MYERNSSLHIVYIHCFFIQEVELTIQMSALNINQNVCENFQDMGLHPEILQGIADYGLEKPAFIQQRAILPAIQGKDVIVQAQSGMGKTAALVIAVLQRLDRNNPKTQALIVVPTRELATQVHNQINLNVVKCNSFQFHSF